MNATNDLTSNVNITFIVTVLEGKVYGIAMNVTRNLTKILTYTGNSARINNITQRNYAFKSDLKIKWVRPAKIPCYKAVVSGDLKPMPEVDFNRYQIEFRNCKGLEDADEIVQRLFKLEFASHKKIVQSYLKDITDSVQRHPFDKGSIESRIARWTGAIRAWQEIMESHPHNKTVKIKVKELIDKRKKHLKYLRRWDYKKFEWLLENLELVYKPHPKEYRWITRKDSLKKLTDKYCRDTVQDKLNEYKLVLQEQQPAFLEEKIRSLEFIRAEQQSCGVEVTVTEEEITNVKKELADLLKERDVSVKDD
ncbi:28s ribosomal protein s15 mitochondrial [Holotrichia oblita]|uniref:28s ribosomal protein s15 mitochondrial n=1 Tax=Holotrichia oblita TaxID=644536 RepID=A0ACB9TK93_HOLOL|nr:28s ribosomal protein s15 mitochondrial [Holotrichia oblita]